MRLGRRVLASTPSGKALLREKHSIFEIAMLAIFGEAVLCHSTVTNSILLRAGRSFLQEWLGVGAWEVSSSLVNPLPDQVRTCSTVQTHNVVRSLGISMSLLTRLAEGFATWPLNLPKAFTSFMRCRA